MQYMVVLMAAVLLSAQNPDDPCRCARSKGSIERDLKRADLVFVGKVVDIGDVSILEHPRRRAEPRIKGTRFTVSRQFKGEPVPKVVVFTDPIWDCTYVFKRGKSYLVYAWRENFWENQFTTTRCIRTALVSDADEDLAALQRLSKERRR